MRQALQQLARSRAGGRAGQQADRRPEPRRVGAANRSAADQPLDRREVLLGQSLGGRHQRRLHPALGDPQHRVQRDDGLARADLAHQQALHRAPAREVGVDLARVPRCWPPVSSNGSDSSQRATSSPGARQRPRPPAPRGAPAPHRRPPAGTGTAPRRPGGGAPRGTSRACGPVGGAERVGAPGGSRSAARSRAGSGSTASRSQAAQAPGQLPDAPRRQSLGRRVDGHQAGRVAPHGLVAAPAATSCSATRKVGPPAPALEPAAQQHPRSLLQLVREIGLVEPHRLHRARCRRRPGTRGSSAGAGAWAAPGSCGPRPTPSPPRPIASSATGRLRS